jgi:hypothetical protein
MQPIPATALRLLPILGCILIASGCRLAGTSAVIGDTLSDAPIEAPRPKPAPRTIHLEVLFVRCERHDPAAGDRLWDAVDEQALGADVRRRLNANGLRAGVVTGDLPAPLAERLAAAGSETTTTDIAGIDAALARRLLQVLPGKRCELVTAAHLPSLVVMEQCDDEVRGATYHDATSQLVIEARPAADGRVQLGVVPEIRHGPVEKSWVGEEGMFRLETGQRRHRMEHLGIDVALPAGGVLLIGGGGEPGASVGDGLLRDQGGEERSTVRLLAIRPLARGVDPAFAPGDAAGDADAPDAIAAE